MHSGFYICLGEDGHVYDDTKYAWLESRQVRYPNPYVCPVSLPMRKVWRM